MNLNVTITGRHLDITDGIKSHVSTRIEKLNKYIKKIDTVNIILTVEKYRHSAEAIVSAKGTSFTSKEVTEDMYSSVDSVFAKIESQLKKHKEKRKSRKGAMRLQPEFDTDLEQAEESFE
jgi:putative sigma-54 modulation protein